MTRIPMLVIHAGAGNTTLEKFREKYGQDAAKEIENYHKALKRILHNSYKMLTTQPASALDAVIDAVKALEDDPLFNAGKGSVLAADGTVEMDASVMDGTSGNCGGVSAVRTVKNPVLAARAVMDHSDHSILCGPGADNFARERGLETADNDYFLTPYRETELKQVQTEKNESPPLNSLGTVGAVAVDGDGRLAAATSTGGMVNKAIGRVSDSSIADAGIWAANDICALSCTGTGDVFIRNATARDVAAMVEYKGDSLEKACQTGLDKVKAAGGEGGIIGIDSKGNAVMTFNTPGMFRGYMDADMNEPFSAIFKDRE